VEVRAAVEDDLEQMVDAMLAEPSVEQLAFMPTIPGAREFARSTWLAAGLDGFVVADDDGDVVGFAWCGESDVSARDGFRAARAAWGVTGPVRLMVKGWPRLLVGLAMPPGPKLIELHTHPSRRGAGVGSLLLDHVIREHGDRAVSLTTRSNNPARRLYERHGFAVVAQKDNRWFERRTGAPGRVLMVRPPPIPELPDAGERAKRTAGISRRPASGLCSIR
jgi:ribosomal protein S18 acetylase RimI-like enzyme